MYSNRIVPLLVLQLAASCSADGVSSVALEPPEEERVLTGYHRLHKRQSACVYFFLLEPPGSLPCNPEPNNTLSLVCELLVGTVNERGGISIGWFYSRDRVIGERQQMSRFKVRGGVAFRSVLVVQNALPGAYFCSVSINRQNLVFDSRALLVDAMTLQDVCPTQEPPTILPPSLAPPLSPRCAQQLPINLSDNLENFTRKATTNTITLNPTPTNSIAVVERTVLPPVVTTPPLPITPSLAQTVPSGLATPVPSVLATPVMGTGSPPTKNNALLLSVTVGVGGPLLLALLVAMLIAGAVWFQRRRRRKGPHLTKRRCIVIERFGVQRFRPNMEPLIGRPPNRPPPVLCLQEPPPTPDPQGEHIEMTTYQEPQPYEVVKSHRYAELPHPSTNVPRPAMGHATPMQATADSEPQYTEPLDAPEEDQYYSRPIFYKKDRGLSTSTHIYGECGNRSSNSSSIYVNPNQLEPFFSSQHATLAPIDERDGHTTSRPSDSSNVCYSNGAGGKEARSSAHSTKHSSEEAGVCSISKSPATGQSGEHRTHGYENTRPDILCHTQVEGEQYHPWYENTPIKPRSTAKIGTRKAVPNVPPRKKVIQQSSMPINGHTGGTTLPGLRGGNTGQGDNIYTGLVHETSNYTSVYTSTLPSKSRQKQS